MIWATFLPVLLSLFQSSNGLNWEVPSKYHHFTKRLAPGLFTGGLLTTRQIEYLSLAGFGSIITLADNNSSLSQFHDIPGNYLSNIDEVKYARELGMDSQSYRITYSVESLYTLSIAMLHMKKPIYLHCYDGYSSTLFGELHLYLDGSADAHDIFRNAATLGYDYQADLAAVNFVNKVTQLSYSLVPPSLELTLPEGSDSYRYYYWSHRNGNDDMWYNIGQILDTQIKSISLSGYQSIISFRSNGEATTRLSSDPSTGSILNNEFSDENGLYSVSLEKNAVEEIGMKFYNLPVTGSSSWSIETLNSYEPTMDEAVSYGPVLAHCSSGYRSSGYVIAYLGRKQKKCTDWALQQARRLGYSFDINSSDEQVVAFFRQALQC